MHAGLLALTQAALLDQLDRDDAAHALRSLVNQVARQLGTPCGLLALGPDGRQRWTAGTLPDAAVRPGTPLLDRHEAFVEDGFCWMPLWRLGQPLGAWLMPVQPGLELGPRAKQLQPVLSAAASLLLRDATGSELRRGGSHGELIRAALRGAGTFVWEWDIATDRLGDLDQGFAQLGYPLPEGGSTQSDWDRLIHPEDREANHGAYLRHAHGQAAVYEHSYRARAADGQWRWIQERGRIIEWNAEGQPQRMVGIQTDVTDRRAAEAAAEAAMSRLVKIAAHVPGLLFQFQWRADGHGSFPYVSERCEALLGVPAAALVADAAAMLRRIDFADRGVMLDSIRDSARRMAPWQLKFRVHRRDKALRWIRGSATPQLGPEGSVVWHGYFEDATEALTIEQAQQDRAGAEAANRAKTEFLSRMSHELRTPLNAVLGFAQLMEVDTSQPLAEDQRRRVGLIRESGEHLLAMINDLLDLTSIEAGRVTLQPEPVLLDPLIEDCLAMVRAGAQRDDVSLLHDPATGLGLHADRKRLRQVLLNLLSNAIKYNRRGGQVRVQAAAREAGWLLLEVRDTGVGLTETEIAQLFQPFNRLSQARSTIEGSGIGLAVTHALVALMGGRIEVQSTPGRGSSFSVLLPDA
ncbi:ATP-binding protein [Aquabacterium sp.]|uniref:sensor histidine kinase n=1 Tax=Aquabacterium sp. TaxID=1872578 RepID=UPI002BBFBB05|nr:ATP-binding protein [Aquabacterium sp.]HSW07077.1 ATP-binding protein [Aquabacterium sp.]